jgi:hypothetical protein
VRTISHFEVYASADGTNAALLALVTNTVTQTNISQLGLAAGTYSIYVDAIGIPCVRDHMSQAVSAIISTSPVVTQQPTNAIVSFGGTATFSVSVTGSLPLSYTWYDQNTNAVGTNSSLVISNATPGNSYYVTVTNQYGKTNSSPATVIAAPVLDTTNYACRMRITFPGYSGSQALTNFPALVQFSNGLTGFSYAQFASSAGSDIRFTDASGLTLLPYEINQWNTSGVSSVWVQVPLLSGTNTSIWAYWGNPAATTPPAYTTNGAVWQPQYMLVWHLEQVGLPYADSTTQYPASTGVAPGLSTGEIGLGGLFNGASSYLHAGTVNLGTAFTLFAWVKLSTSATNVQAIWANGATGYNSDGFALFVNTYNTANKSLLLQDGDGVTGDTVTSATNIVTAGVWHGIAASINETAGTAQLYVDGVNVASGNAMTNFVNNSGLDFGQYTNGNFYFNGSMDEARVAPGICSSDWISATYLNMASNSVFTSSSAVNLPPMLSCASSASGPLLTWPVTAGVYVIYTATNLAPPVAWLPATNVPAYVNGQWQSQISPPANGTQFYQLQAH